MGESLNAGFVHPFDRRVNRSARKKTGVVTDMTYDPTRNLETRTEVPGISIAGSGDGGIGLNPNFPTVVIGVQIVF